MATIKQKLAATKMVENGGNIGKAMREVGYSNAMSKNPQKLTRSKGWQEIIDKYIREDKLLNVHRRLLNSIKLERYLFELDVSDKAIYKILSKIKSSKLIRIIKGEKAKTCYYIAPDEITQLSALNMAYKIRGRYKENKEDHGKNERLEAVLDRFSAALPDAQL